MTIGTAPLTLTAAWQEIDALVAFLAGLDIHQVAITYGWGCNARSIEQPVTVPTTALVEFLHKSIAQGIYHLGEDNLYIEANFGAHAVEERTVTLKIKLCHEADIHFETTDTAIEARLQAEWQNRGLRVWAGKSRV